MKQTYLQLMMVQLFQRQLPIQTHMDHMEKLYSMVEVYLLIQVITQKV